MFRDIYAFLKYSFSYNYTAYNNSSKEVEKRFKNFMDLIFIYQQKKNNRR